MYVSEGRVVPHIMGVCAHAMCVRACALLTLVDVHEAGRY